MFSVISAIFTASFLFMKVSAIIDGHCATSDVNSFVDPSPNITVQGCNFLTQNRCTLPRNTPFNISVTFTNYGPPISACNLVAIEFMGVEGEVIPVRIPGGATPCTTRGLTCPIATNSVNTYTVTVTIPFNGEKFGPDEIFYITLRLKNLGAYPEQTVFCVEIPVGPQIQAGCGYGY